MLGRFLRAVHRDRSTPEATRKIEALAARIDAQAAKLEHNTVADALGDLARGFKA